MTNLCYPLGGLPAVDGACGSGIVCEAAGVAVPAAENRGSDLIRDPQSEGLQPSNHMTCLNWSKSRYLPVNLMLFPFFSVKA